MQFKVMDISDMSVFDSNSFDMVIDKCTLDCMLECIDPGIAIVQMLKETQRVLKIARAYLVFSYGRPIDRVYLFTQPFLSLDVQELVIADYSNNYLYINTKLPDADQKSETHYEAYMNTLLSDAEIYCSDPEIF